MLIKPAQFTLGLVMLISLAKAQIPYQKFEIVESIPVETSLDNLDIRNTAEVWLEMIEQARKTIDIEQFYFSNQAGEALERIIAGLEAAAARQVKIRIIADGRMANTYPETLNRLKQQPNIQVRLLTAFNQAGGIQHAKYFIVDRQQVFQGSQNFDWRALDHIHEIGVRIQHPAYALLLTDLFNLDWEQAVSGVLTDQDFSMKTTRFQLQLPQQQTLTFFASASPSNNIPEGFRWDEEIIVELIDSAKSEVCIQLLSYSPRAGRRTYYEVLDNALRRAAVRGVKINLLVSDWCQHDSQMPYLKSLAVIPNITVKESTIPEWSGGYISFARVEHCKLLIVDDEWSWIGSSNWNKDYFHESRNIAVTVQDEEVNRILKAIFMKSWEGPYSWLVEPQRDYQPKYYGEKP